MADPDINELRALRRKAQAVIEQAEAALKEWRTLDGAMGATINRLLAKNQNRDPDVLPRERTGSIQKRFCRTISDLGGKPNGAWVVFELIAADLPDISEADLRKSLLLAVERLIETDGDAYRLLPAGAALLS